ncbi:GTPase HflX, partial [Rossellomorea aquimaris]
TRGPGETKLESDRRHINRRIVDIKTQLTSIVSHRERYRERRKRNQAFQLSLVGYTNAGKSTIFNRLTEAGTFEENLLFATLDPTTRKVMMPSGFNALLTDTVGFIQDLPTSLVAAFRSTLEEVTEADLILHVVDSSSPDHVNHEKTVDKLLKELGVEGVPVLTIYNKKDQTAEGFTPAYNQEILHISALDPMDITL